jgi:hypothetical protein
MFFSSLTEAIYLNQLGVLWDDFVNIVTCMNESIAEHATLQHFRGGFDAEWQSKFDGDEEDYGKFLKIQK